MGWYADPGGSKKERYWDGARWTRNLRTRPEEPREQGRHSEGGRLRVGRPSRKVVERRSADNPKPVRVPQEAPRPQHEEVQRPARAAATDDGLPLAGWWWRVLSTVIDQALIWILVSVIMRRQIADFAAGYQKIILNAYQDAASGGAMPSMTQMSQQLASSGIMSSLTLVMVVAIVLQASYQAILLMVVGGSVGQLVCRLRVVETGHGRSHRHLLWWRALVRALTWAAVEYIGQMGLGLLSTLSYLMPLWTRRRQTIHDMVGGTQVIRLPRH